MESNTKVWIEKNRHWYSGIIVSQNDVEILIKYDHNKKTECITNKSRISLKNNEGDNVNDLMNLQHLNEPSVLNALLTRYQQNVIYTYTGPILIAVNPFKNLNIYDDGNIKIFNDNDNKLECPHLYGVISQVFSNIKNKKGDQSVLISGNSGSGKTFSTRYIMRYLSKVSSNFDTNVNSVERKLLESNPIIEAFGNAKTLMNDNSSRFGKYIKIYFDKNDKMIGANIETYLLEKVRLINQKIGERNFHIFYLILSSMTDSQKEKYKLTKMIDYKILCDSKCFVRDDGINDQDKYKELIQAFHIMNFSQNNIENIFSIVSAILHLGNIVIKNNTIQDENILKNVSDLLLIEYHDLKKSLIQKKIIVNNEIFIKSLTDDESYNVITTLIKVIYENMFNWIVNKINQNFVNSNYEQFIGLLDIFGFEVFDKNNFEQMCINYANESLQQQFNKYILKNEQKLYQDEEIEWDFIDFPDNKECLNLFEHKIHGILSKMDEECLFPSGNDNDLYDKIYKYKKDQNTLSITNMQRINNLFTIHHYPGDVTYSINGFVAKNKDRLNGYAVKVLLKSNNNILQTFDKKQLLSLTTLTSISISKQFQNQLNNLLNIISKTSPYYIRCLKPNDKNKPNNFRKQAIVNQLKYSGVLEAIKISRYGFPIRILHDDFNEKYSMIFDNININDKKLKVILKDDKFYIDCKKYQVGLTKIFLKKKEYEEIEAIRSKILNRCAITIQKIFKGWRIKKWFINYKKHVIITQKITRGFLARKRVQKIKMNLAAIKIQSIFRGYTCRKQYLRKLRLIRLIQRKYRKNIRKRQKMETFKDYCVTKIQSTWKMYQIRTRFVNFRKKCIIIQCYIKTYNAKKLLRQLKTDKAKLEKLKLDNDILQTNLENTSNILNNLRENYIKQKNEMNQLRMKMKQQESELHQKEYNIKTELRSNEEKIQNIYNENIDLQNIINECKILEDTHKQKIVNNEKQKKEDDETKMLLAMKINELLLKHNNAISEIRRLKHNQNEEMSFVNFIRNLFR